MSKSCWSLPPEASSPGEEAAALQAILNGYLAAVPKRNPSDADDNVARCAYFIKDKGKITGGIVLVKKKS